MASSQPPGYSCRFEVDPKEHDSSGEEREVLRPLPGCQTTMKPAGEDSRRVVLLAQIQSEWRSSGHDLAVALARGIDSGCPNHMLRVRKAAKAVSRGRG